jgi:TPR repeat protein
VGEPAVPTEGVLPGAAGAPEAATPARPGSKALRSWIIGAIAVLILAGAAVSYLRGPGSGAPSSHAAPDIPPSLRPYYDRAQDGDASAMRMLGTMYYNGLNVPQNSREGIRWFRKAAAAGSVAAQKDLEQLNLAPERPDLAPERPDLAPERPDPAPERPEPPAQP